MCALAATDAKTAPDCGFLERLATALCDAGVKRGGILMLHSDTAALSAAVAPMAPGQSFALLRDGVLLALGPKGTLVVPTFNYDFCKGRPFNPARTRSQVGLFTGFVMTSPGACRSRHPIFSVAAIGADAEALTKDVPADCFSVDSIFGRLHARNAQLGFLNTDFQSCTFIHYVEQAAQVGYRRMKRFSGVLQESAGERPIVADYFVRKETLTVVTRLERLRDRLLDRGAMVQRATPGGPLQLTDCRTVFDLGTAALAEDPCFFLAGPAIPSGDT